MGEKFDKDSDEDDGPLGDEEFDKDSDEEGEQTETTSENLTDKQYVAATKLQARQRGASTRVKLARERAATKIQAHQRGRHQRITMKAESKTPHEDANNEEF